MQDCITPLSDGYKVYVAARLTQLAVSYMREQRAGKIVNITSVEEKATRLRGRGITRPSTPLKGGPTAFALNSQLSASM